MSLLATGLAHLPGTESRTSPMPDRHLTPHVREVESGGGIPHSPRCYNVRYVCVVASRIERKGDGGVGIGKDRAPRCDTRAGDRCSHYYIPGSCIVGKQSGKPRSTQRGRGSRRRCGGLDSKSVEQIGISCATYRRTITPEPASRNTQSVPKHDQRAGRTYSASGVQLSHTHSIISNLGCGYRLILEIARPDCGNRNKKRNIISKRSRHIPGLNL